MSFLLYFYIFLEVGKVGRKMDFKKSLKRMQFNIPVNFNYTDPQFVPLRGGGIDKNVAFIRYKCHKCTTYACCRDTGS